MKRILALVLTVLLALTCLGGFAVAEEKARVAFILQGAIRTPTASWS